MGLKSKPLRYAHAEGHTDICYNEDGQFLITCGNDGDVRIWAGLEDDDPNSHCVGEWALAVAFKDKRIYVATDNHAIQAYTYPAFDKDGVVTRFTAPVTHIMTSNKIDVLGCASENMEAKICQPEGGAPIFMMTQHNGPVLSVSVCPQMKYSTTSCGDGALRIWDIDTQKLIKEIACVPKINTFYSAKVLCRTSFEPNSGKYLAYPSNREIVILDCETWSQISTLTHDRIKCAISQCQYSPCGQFLAGSTVAGQICIWELNTGNPIGIIDHPTSHNVSALAWNPKGNGELAYCDVAGQIGIIENSDGRETARTENIDIDNAILAINDDNDENIVDNLIERYDSDDDNGISLENIKNETLRKADRERSRPSSRQSSVSRVLGPATIPLQPPFQPSSTPLHLEHRYIVANDNEAVEKYRQVNDNKQKQYMCWNEVGIVRCHTAASGESSIEVEFHDINTHHGIHLNNYLNHTMASLSETVLVLACETPSKMVCISLLGSSKEWSVSMPDTEEILCVAAASGLVACATNARLLRLFTPMGTQREVISLPGPVVALSGHNATIFSIYHQSQMNLHDQQLGMDIIAVQGQQVRSKTVPVPLTPRSKLSWMGFTDVGSPCTFDNDGLLRIYALTSGIWMPICDTKSHSKGASDSWFIVSVSESTATVRTVLCRGASFPLTTPKPTISQLPIQLSFCELDSEKGLYEEQLTRWAHLKEDVDTKNVRETALKLFALACRSEVEQRALELMELLRDERLLPLAARYASRLGRMHLADKLTNLATDVTNDDTSDTTNVNQHFQEMANGANEDHSQDMKLSLIVPTKANEKKTETITPIKPVSMKPMSGGRNPFKKINDGSKSTTASPLSLTERNLVASQSLDSSEQNIDPMIPKESENFVEWYGRNQETLGRECPDLTPAELMKHAIKVFRNKQTKVIDSNTPTNKRKIPDEDEAPIANVSPAASVPKQSKLSAFAFQKKS